MRIGIDIDSTLHHYWDLFERVAHDRFGIRLRYEEQVTWNIGLLRPEQLHVVVEETHRAEHVLAAEPYPGAVEAVRAWREQGHFIHITSHRSTDCHAHTVQWLDRIGLQYDELYCSWDKIARAQEIGLDVLVDDSPTNISRALDAGIVPATLLHPWNRDIVEDDGVIAAEDWPGLADALAPVLAGDRSPGSGSRA